MEDMDTTVKLESPHHVDYDAMLENVIQNDHELLYLDTCLMETFGGGQTN